MISLDTLPVFFLAVILLLLSPGPNMAFVLSQAIARGWRGGLMAAVGITIADLTLAVLTATGVTALVASWPPSFDVIRYAGVLYLLWLAFKTLRGGGGLGALDTREQQPLMRILFSATLNSLLNPKALLFFMVFLPQFVQPERGQVGWQLIQLGVMLALTATVFHSLLGVFGAAIHRRLASTGRWAKVQSLGLATVLTMLAVRLALLSRP
ncbi:hypothetical protein PMM47T1_13410 [Pseudomonas sp. M47T1]|uniref:LysE family translocator n=1 Tax=Pseudomonas sp. M47T1 TaxID=1179778 RepID=UPI0002607DAC|nr:LysE family translocator [Pseudomonas sp. M47T1]EIK95960.1 hypothetical protein PMM47T1_13410 [Pseudomonas sp. M47T1]